MEFPSFYSIGAYSGLLYNEYWEVYPGTYWRYFELEGDGRLILTSDFLTIEPDKQHDILWFLKNWRENSASIGRGMEGSVYASIDGAYVMKVATNPLHLFGNSPEERFINSAYLRASVLPELPLWADIVPSYICVIDQHDNRYTVMPKVGEGITLYNLYKYCHPLSSRNSHNTDNVIRTNFPDFGLYEYERVKGEFYNLTNMVRRMASGLFRGPNANFDIKPDNVLVTPLLEPIEGYKYMLSLIDL